MGQPYGQVQRGAEYGLTENGIARIRQSLTPKELKLLDYVKESYKEIYPKLRDYMLAHFDYILPEEGNYVRIYRKGPTIRVIYLTMFTGLVDEARERRYTRRYVGHTFTKERTALGAQELPRLRLGLVSNYLSYLYETTYFMSYGEFARQTAYMLGSKSPLIEEVRRTFGDDVVRALQDWQKRIADPSGYKAHSAFDAAIRFFQGKRHDSMACGQHIHVHEAAGIGLLCGQRGRLGAHLCGVAGRGDRLEDDEEVRA